MKPTAFTLRAISVLLIGLFALLPTACKESTTESGDEGVADERGVPHSTDAVAESPVDDGPERIEQNLLERAKPRLVSQTLAGFNSNLSESRLKKISAISNNGRWIAIAHESSPIMIWDVDSGREVKRISVADPRLLKALAFSPDDRVIAAQTQDYTTLYHIDTGSVLRQFQAESTTFLDANSIVATDSRSARILELASGRQLARFVHRGVRDGRALKGDRLLTAGTRGGMRSRIVEWRVSTGELLREFNVGIHVDSIQVREDQNLIILSGSVHHSSRTRTAHVTSHAGTPREKTEARTGPEWVQGVLVVELDTGDELLRLEDVQLAAVSPDGSSLLTIAPERLFNGLPEGGATLWDIRSGERLHEFKDVLGYAEERFRLEDGQWIKEEGREDVLGPITSAAFHPDARHILTAGHSHRLWNIEAKVPTQEYGLSGVSMRLVGIDYEAGTLYTTTFGNHVAWSLRDGYPALVRRSHESLNVLSADGRLRASGLSPLRISEVHTEDVILTVHPDDANAWTLACFGSDCTTFVTLSKAGILQTWGLGSDQAQRTNALQVTSDDYFTGIRVSNDGQFVLVVGSRTIKLFRISDGAVVTQFSAIDAAFSPDSTSVLAVGPTCQLFRIDQMRTAWSSEIYSWNLRNDRREGGAFGMLAFNQDGTRAIVSIERNGFQLLDTASGEAVREFVGHGVVHSLAFLSDDTKCISVGTDQTLRVWDVNTGQELCRLMTFEDNTWAVVDAEGRYDASNGGDVKGLHWVVGMEPIELSQLKERYYDPGLLSKIMGYNDEPLRAVAAFDHLDLYPAITLNEPQQSDGELEVTLTNRDGGIGRVQILINGKEVTGDARAPDHAPDAESITITRHLNGHPYLVPGETNSIEVKVFNKSGYLSSRGVKRTYTLSGEETIDTSLHAIVIGTSDYAGDELDLKFAAKDALDIASGIKIGAHGLFGVDNVHLSLLATGSAGLPPPTKANITNAFRAARQARPTDVLLVYIAGHGVTHGGDDSEFYYLTADARSSNITDPAIREQVAISSHELTELIKGVPALKQVLILDTCASGRVVERLVEQRQVPSSQIRALERMKDRTGIHVIAGCAADAVSYEATRYAQGLLTHSLLLGMRGGALRDDEFVDVRRWFEFAADQVPLLAKDIGGIQRPMLASPRGEGSFDVGRVSSDVRAEIPLEVARPMFVRANFMDVEKFRDHLGLQKTVNDQLRDLSASTRGTPLVFLDATEAPDAYSLSGGYRVEDESVTTNVVISRGDDEHTFEVTGNRDDVDALATTILERARELVEIGP